MHYYCSDTAILLFIRTVHEEARAKELYPRLSYQRKLSLVRVMNNNAQKVAQNTQYPTFVFSGAAQSGVTFGEKLANAIRCIFQKGFQNVIAIGNDCLELDQQHLCLAAKQLEHSPLVIGPAKDGGTYLIGINRNIFDHEALLALPWQGKDLLEAFTYWAEERGISTFFLSEQEDVDSADVFKALLKRLSYNEFKYQILDALGLFAAQPQVQLSPLASSFVTATLFQRGPPSPFFFADI